MLQFALNVRQQQLNAHNTALRISRQNIFTARKLIGRCVLLYAPRDEPRPGYFGQATIIGVYPDLQNPAFIWLHLAGQRIFDRPVSLAELYDAGDINDTPFHAYARALRVISPSELSRLAAFEILPREQSVEFAETTTPDLEPSAQGRRKTWVSRIVRRSIIRFQMLEYYGPKCVFSGEFHPSLDRLDYSVHRPS